MTFSKLLRHPLFLFGLFLRITLILLLSPQRVLEWYAPFLDRSTQFFNLDPWAIWLNHGGNGIAFPYGYVMWLLFLPLSLFCKIVALPLTYAYGMTLLTVDLGILQVLRRLIPERDKVLLSAYWLSPIVILASYLQGFNDVIPVFFLVLSLRFTQQYQLARAGLAFTAAISAKLSMVLALPYFLIYLFHNRCMRQFFGAYLRGLSFGILIFLLPFAFSGAGLFMLWDNPEMRKVFGLALPLGETTRLYLVPIVYSLMLYLTWRVRRLNFELFQTMLGMAFLLVVLLTPASPGWFIWALPLLVFYQASSDRIAVVLSTIFSMLYVISSLLYSPGDWPINWGQEHLKLAAAQGDWLSKTQTVMVAIGILLAMRIWRQTVSRNDFFRLSRKPFVIGIAGDSGSGKDTLSDSITGLFGSHSVATLSGDDYHLWDRHKPMWQVMTHLNPMANDLEAFAQDLVQLNDGNSILSRHYDHETGRMSRPRIQASNDIIIASGLHALYLPILRECYNLSIFLDIHEGLRRYFKLQRDVNQRGHSREKVLSSFDRREPDAERFIRPQASHADLHLSLQPIHPRMLDEENSKHPLRFKLIVRSRHGMNEQSLVRVLVGVCGLHVDMQVNQEASETELTIEGESSAQDVAMAAQILCPRLFEFMDTKPQWQDGISGLMQLVVLSHINQALTKRFI